MLHIVAMLIHIAHDFLAWFEFTSIVAELRECSLKFALVSLLGVVDYGYRLVSYACDDVANTLFKTKPVLDLLMALQG